MAKTLKTTEQTEVSEAQIAVHWKEEAYYQPSEKFKAQANLRDPRIFEKFGLDKFPDCFKVYAEMLTWFEPYHTVLDTSDAPFWNGSSAARSTRPTTAWTATWSSTAARPHSFSCPNRRPSATSPSPIGSCTTGSTKLPRCSRASDSKRATASPCTCPWSPSCRSRCWRVPDWASSTRKSSAGSAARRAARAF